MDLELSDTDVLARAAEGDSEAFGILYDRYIGRIYNYIYYRTGNQHDAEDLTSRVFTRAIKHITNYEDRGLPFSAWLYRIAHNLVANWHRDNSRRQIVELDESYRLPSNHEPPETRVVRSEQEQFLMDLVSDLPEDRQQLLILKFVDHLSNAEIGEIMGRTEGAIKSLYHRTLLALRDEVKNLDPSHPFFQSNGLGE